MLTPYPFDDEAENESKPERGVPEEDLLPLNKKTLIWLKKLYEEKENEIQIIEDQLSSSCCKKTCSILIIFNDSTGMASSIYFIVITIFTGTLAAWLGFIGATIAAIVFSFDLYKTHVSEETQNKNEITTYVELIDAHITQALKISNMIKSLLLRLEEQGWFLDLTLLFSIQEFKLKKAEDKRPSSLKDYEQEILAPLLAPSLLNEEKNPLSGDRWEIRFLITLITTTGSIFTLGKLILTGLTIPLTGPVGIILVSSIFFTYALPIAIAQRVFNKTTKKNTDQLKNEKKRMQARTTTDIQKLLNLAAFLSNQATETRITSRLRRIHSESSISTMNIYTKPQPSPLTQLQNKNLLAPLVATQKPRKLLIHS